MTNSNGNSIILLPADRIVGMMHVAQLLWLGQKASIASSVLEIGSYRGRSTRVLCDNCRGLVTAVDTWRGSPGLEEELETLVSASGDKDWLYHEFLYNTRDCPNLKIVRMPSVEAASAIGFDIYDMIFIDGLHDFDSVRADISAWLPHLAPGGMMCGHDFGFPDVARAVRSCFSNFPDRTDGDIWAVCLRGGERWALSR